MDDIFKGKDGQFYFRVKGDNGETLAVSEGYVSRSNAERGLKTLQEAWDRDGEMWEEEDSHACPDGLCDRDGECVPGECQNDM